MKVNVEAVMDPETRALSWLLETRVLLCSVSTHIPSSMVPKSLTERAQQGSMKYLGTSTEKEKCDGC